MSTRPKNMKKTNKSPFRRRFSGFRISNNVSSEEIISRLLWFREKTSSESFPKEENRKVSIRSAESKRLVNPIRSDCPIFKSAYRSTRARWWTLVARWMDCTGICRCPRPAPPVWADDLWWQFLFRWLRSLLPWANRNW